MGQIENEIIYDIAQQGLPITFDAIRSALRKHLEPQKKYPKLRCKECGSSYEYIIQDGRAPICGNCKGQKLEEID